MRIHRIVFSVITFAMGCVAGPSGEPPEDPVGRGLGGKADAVVRGSCSDGTAALCGGQGSESCWCDADCARFGDCCRDAAPVCGIQSNRLSDRTAGKAPLLDGSALEVMAELPYPPGNVAVTPEGRVFFSFHPEGNKGDVQVAELVEGQPVAFPDEDFQDDLHTVLSVRVDRHGRLFMLDYGSLGLHRARLIAVDIASRNVVLDYELPRSAAGVGSMMNDFQISPDGDTVYIADPSPLARDEALVVIDLGREQPIARRRLPNHPSLSNGPYDVFVDDVMVRALGIRPSYGVDSIALDQAGEYLYYASLNTGALYQVSAFDLRFEDSGLLDDALAERVEHVADITLSDGIATDEAGHVYVTSMEHSAITRVARDGTLEVLVQDPRLRWPDGLSWGPDGYLYITASALQHYLPQVIRSRDDIARHAPYHIFRLRAGDACAVESGCAGTPGH